MKTLRLSDICQKSEVVFLLMRPRIVYTQICMTLGQKLGFIILYYLFECEYTATQAEPYLWVGLRVGKKVLIKTRRLEAYLKAS